MQTNPANHQTSPAQRSLCSSGACRVIHPGMKEQHEEPAPCKRAAPWSRAWAGAQPRGGSRRARLQGLLWGAWLWGAWLWGARPGLSWEAGTDGPLHHPQPRSQQSQLSPLNAQNKLTELLAARGECAAAGDLSIFNDRRVSCSTCFSGYERAHHSAPLNDERAHRSAPRDETGGVTAGGGADTPSPKSVLIRERPAQSSAASPSHTANRAKALMNQSFCLLSQLQQLSCI